MTAARERHPRLARVLATSFVALVALLVAVWVAPRASGAAATWLHTPPVRLQTLPAPGDGTLAVAGPQGRGAGAPVTLDAGARFTMAAVLCDGPPTAITVRLRTSLDGASWGAWYEAPLERAAESPVAGAYTDPVWTGDARYVQVAAATGSPGGPEALSGVRIVLIDPTESADVAARLAGGVRRVAAAVAGVSFEQPAVAAVSAPSIVTRAEWGADERLRSGSPAYSPVKMAFVHHTAGGTTYTQADAPALVRGIYAYHTGSLGWSDIGYNFLVDRFGTIYEGRYGGMDRGVVGAQVGGFNTGSTGISVMGTFSDAAPPAAAVTSLERLLAWKLGVAGLDPAGTAQLTCGLKDRYAVGEVVTFPVIAGHRDANYTECPGERFYALLPALRTAVAQRMGTALSVSLRASRSLISPNGDGVLDSVKFTASLSAPSGWKLVVRDAAGRTVAAWSGQGSAASVTWDGASGGSRVADGAYTAELAAGEDGATATAAVTVDTTAPRLAAASVSPASYSPNGDGRDETSTVTYRPAEACSVRVGILDADGKIVRWLHGWRAQKEQSYSVAWDGRVTSGGGLVAAADGQYRFDVERRDAAGNIARQGIKVLVDRTLGFPAAGPTSFSPNGDGVLDSTRLGFRLTRKASVTVRVRVDDQVVRTLTLGTLAAGKHTMVWDGRAGSGETLASCRPVFTVTAVSTLGESSVTRALVVDLTSPRIYAGGGKAATAGTSTRLGFKIVDAFSAKADVRFTVTDARGRRVASGHPGKLPTGQALTLSWKPAGRGTYTVTFRATDLAGNRQAAPASTVVTVR